MPGFRGSLREVRGVGSREIGFAGLVHGLELVLLVYCANCMGILVLGSVCSILAHAFGDRWDPKERGAWAVSSVMSGCIFISCISERIANDLFTFDGSRVSTQFSWLYMSCLLCFVLGCILSCTRW